MIVGFLRHASADAQVAVIGISVRLPGASAPADFWRLLRDDGQLPPRPAIRSTTRP
ncbi:beta-ketoacyl synthase N-terminal-like domain-containing protein [Streptomyces sp. Rer75]|uniref:beta-ketoacyl synthase N-terminal-like domain-containing protein n=1 Tax=unclassified Streptomyces TaxID=2593676 RepID=UPI0035A186CA